MTNSNQQSTTLIQLWTKNTAIVRKIDASLGAVHGIGFTEYLVLHHLNASTHRLMRRIDLAEALGRSASAITKMLNPMEKIGFVSKENNPRDARVSLVKLTATGLNSYQQATNTVNQIAAEIFQRIDSTDTEQMHGLVSGLNV